MSPEEKRFAFKQELKKKFSHVSDPYSEITEWALTDFIMEYFDMQTEERCGYCSPDGTIRNGDSEIICNHCNGTSFKPQAEGNELRVDNDLKFQVAEKLGEQYRTIGRSENFSNAIELIELIGSHFTQNNELRVAAEKAIETTIEANTKLLYLALFNLSESPRFNEINKLQKQVIDDLEQALDPNQESKNKEK